MYFTRMVAHIGKLVVGMGTGHDVEKMQVIVHCTWPEFVLGNGWDLAPYIDLRKNNRKFIKSKLSRLIPYSNIQNVGSTFSMP